MATGLGVAQPGTPAESNKLGDQGTAAAQPVVAEDAVVEVRASCVAVIAERRFLSSVSFPRVVFLRL